MSYSEDDGGGDDSSSYASSTHTLESDDEVPPKLAEYYDRAGDVSVISDSLNDLELDRLEKKSQRDLLEDQDVRLATSEAQFEAPYDRRRYLLRKQLAETRCNVDFLRSQCIRLGLDIESRKWRTMRSPCASVPSITGLDLTSERKPSTPSMTSASSVADTSVSSVPSDRGTGRWSTFSDAPASTIPNGLRVKQARIVPRSIVSSFALYDQGRYAYSYSEQQSKPRAVYASSLAKPSPGTVTDSVTDPDLRMLYGVTAHKRLQQSSHGQDWKMRLQSHKFFTFGKVFIMPLEEGTADDNTSITIEPTAENPKGLRYRRLVVVKEADTECSAIPITTLNGEGVVKPGVKKSNFTIIYTGSVPPPALYGEMHQRNGEPMRPNPIRVEPEDRSMKLDSLSRLNFAKVYTVEHDTKVKHFGTVHNDSRRDLLYQFKDVWTSSGRRPVR